MGTLSNPTIKELEKRMDTLCQTCSRCKGCWFSNGTLVNKCVTCGKVCPCFGKDSLDGGHFIPRSCRTTRWEQDNVWPQCTRCNRFLNGAYIEYSAWMIKHHHDAYKGLMNSYENYKRGNPIKLSAIEKRALYNSWLQKGRDLERKSGLKLFPKKWGYAKI